MTSRDTMLQELSPTARALLEAAGSEAAAILAAADADARRQLAAARETAGRCLRDARADGEREARAAVERTRQQLQRDSRSAQLAAQRELHDDLRRRLQDRTAQLRADPRYEAVLHGLSTAIRQRLGPAATVREAASGGAVGEYEHRRLDLSLAALTEQALAACPGEISSLWQ